MVATHRTATASGRRIARLTTVVIALTASACTSGGTATPPPEPTQANGSVESSEVPQPARPRPERAATATTTPTDGARFDDHTVPSLTSVEQFHALARSGPGGASVVKFSIPEMDVRDDVVWLDSTFYEVHDQWYWFRLLNGERVPGFEADPVHGLSFDTIDEVVAWAAEQDAEALPLDLRFIDSRTYGRRLYSDDFYRLGFTKTERNYGLGSVIHFPDAADGEMHWLLELQFSDVPTSAEVGRYFDLLTATLPSEIGDRLEWVLRSPAQEQVAIAMDATGAPYHDRIVRYRDLVPVGRVEVYNPGLAAGRLLIVDGVTTTLADARATDIVVVENVPDELPAAAALITSAPQTPLAHVNLLARTRGIPNASQSGILDHAGLRQAARVGARAIVKTSADGQLEIALIDREEYDEWRELTEVRPTSVPLIDRDSTPTVVDLTSLASTISTDADIEPLRPLVGGKSAGFLTLLAAPGVDTPHRPLAITVRPYLEHLDNVTAELDAMLADDTFRRSARARFLFLEGPDDYAERHRRDVDTAHATEIIAAHPTGTLLGDVLAAGGFKRFFRDVRMDAAVLAEITDRLNEVYATYAPTQGLRFRSSSSVEDIEGFTGAGLYDSNTGFLDPSAQPDAGDRDRTVERAITKTWASYWSFEAFEERELARIDHRSGAMGVLVHARFDDELELANGVATFTLLPAADAFEAVAIVNVQAGAESVTNPDPTSGSLPEVIELWLRSDGSVRIDRRTSSRRADVDVLDDDTARELFEQLRSLTELWRERVNGSLPASQNVDTVTLDTEFKLMAPGWPALRSGDEEPTRLVVKQARSLDPGLRSVPLAVRELPIPRDVLARASRVVATECLREDGPRSVVRLEVTTDPTLLPDLGHSVTPLVIDIGPVAAEGRCDEAVVLSTADDFLLDLLETATVLTNVG